MGEPWDDDDFSRMLDETIQRREQAEADRLLAQLEQQPSVGTVPAPGEWHPFYEKHRGWLLAWLNEWPGLVSPTLNEVVIPAPAKCDRAMFDAQPTFSDIRTILMTKRRACGPAPYVGRPFVYRWNVGVDQHGRMVAGDARIQYIDGGPS